MPQHFLEYETTKSFCNFFCAVSSTHLVGFHGALSVIFYAIYVTEQGALIRLIGGKIVIEKSKKILAEVPKNTIDGLILSSNVQITPQAVLKFLHVGIPVKRKPYGKISGRLRRARSEICILSTFKQKALCRYVEAC